MSSTKTFRTDKSAGSLRDSLKEGINNTYNNLNKGYIYVGKEFRFSPATDDINFNKSIERDIIYRTDPKEMMYKINNKVSVIYALRTVGIECICIASGSYGRIYKVSPKKGVTSENPFIIKRRQVEKDKDKEFKFKLYGKKFSNKL